MNRKATFQVRVTLKCLKVTYPTNQPQQLQQLLTRHFTTSNFCFNFARRNNNNSSNSKTSSAPVQPSTAPYPDSHPLKTTIFSTTCNPQSRGFALMRESERARERERWTKAKWREDCFCCSRQYNNHSSNLLGANSIKFTFKNCNVGNSDDDEGGLPGKKKMTLLQRWNVC